MYPAREDSAENAKDIERKESQICIPYQPEPAFTALERHAEKASIPGYQAGTQIRNEFHGKRRLLLRQSSFSGRAMLLISELLQYKSEPEKFGLVDFVKR